MKHTLVAAFETLTDANRTRGDLMSRGIPREHIHAMGADSAETYGYDSPYNTTDSTVDQTDHESRIGHFFRSLFGDDSRDEHRHYSTAFNEAVQRGGLVVAVDVYNDDELARARDALEYNNAIDITGTTGKFAGISSSPYVGATGGDSHLDTHRDHLDRYRDDPEKLRELRRGEQHYQERTGSHEWTGAAASSERYSESERPGAGGPVGSAAGSGRTSDATARTGHGDRTGSADTGRYDVGSAGKRAGTDYPDTTATHAPTGGGTTGYGSSVGTSDVGRTAGSDVGGEGSQELGGTRHDQCTDRVCVIRRPDDEGYPR